MLDLESDALGLLLMGTTNSTPSGRPGSPQGNGRGRNPLKVFRSTRKSSQSSQNSNDSGRIQPPQVAQQEINQLTNWVIPAQHIKWHQEIAKGAFGEVWRCEWFSHPAAVKVLFKALDLENDPEAAEEFRNECKTLRGIKHPHLIKFFGAGVTERESGFGINLRMPFLMTEFMDLGSLRNVLDESPRIFSQQVLMRLAYEVALGMQCLHVTHGIVHRDLKSENVLVDKKFRAKICDFGSSLLRGKNNDVYSSDAQQEENGWAGTMFWAAPETFDKNSTRTGKVDLYSYGIVMYEILTRRTPFDDVKGEFIEIWEFLGENVPQGVRPTLEADFADENKDYVTLMKKCWQTDAEARPAFDEVVLELRKLV